MTSVSETTSTLRYELRSREIYIEQPMTSQRYCRSTPRRRRKASAASRRRRTVNSGWSSRHTSSLTFVPTPDSPKDQSPPSPTSSTSSLTSFHTCNTSLELPHLTPYLYTGVLFPNYWRENWMWVGWNAWFDTAWTSSFLKLAIICTFIYVVIIRATLNFACTLAPRPHFTLSVLKIITYKPSAFLLPLWPHKASKDSEEGFIVLWMSKGAPKHWRGYDCYVG